MLWALNGLPLLLGSDAATGGPGIRLLAVLTFALIAIVGLLLATSLARCATPSARRRRGLRTHMRVLRGLCQKQEYGRDAAIDGGLLIER
jgi:hypothetical protein